MAATIGGITIPTGWISANDDNYIEWTGAEYTGIFHTNNGGNLALTISTPTTYAQMELCGYLKLSGTTNNGGTSNGVYKVIGGSSTSPNQYTLVLDANYIAGLTGSWKVHLLWDINALVVGGFFGLSTEIINEAKGMLAFNYKTGIAKLNLREYTRHFFTGYYPYAPSLYDKMLYRHLLIYFEGRGAFATWLNLNGLTVFSVTGYNPTAYTIRCLNSGMTNQQINQFVTGNRPIADHHPFDDCNSRNIHSYISGNDVITVANGILPAGVDFDKIDIDLISY